jgi:hypothetical protein
MVYRMAYRVSTDGANVKIRKSSAVGVLALITATIYADVWYYKINREMRDLAQLGWQLFTWLVPVAAVVGAPHVPQSRRPVMVSFPSAAIVTT